MQCPICKGSSIFLKNIEGYKQGMNFDIYKCEKCLSHHMDIQKLNKEMYDEIYNNSSEIAGYDRYYNYLYSIKNQDNALKRLAEKDDVYYPIYEELKNKNGNKVLEIGCGFGYLTYAINSSGNTCQGFDISTQAIEQARKSFGDYYYTSDIFNNSSDLQQESFDYIVATELIEHIDFHDKFFSECFKLLKKGGKCIITTPNRDFYGKEHFWLGDLPPIHTSRITKRAFSEVALRYNVNILFFPLGKFAQNTNYLFQKIVWNNIRKKNGLSKSLICEKEEGTSSTSRGILIQIFDLLQPIIESNTVRSISNWMCCRLYGPVDSVSTLCSIFQKK